MGKPNIYLCPVKEKMPNIVDATLVSCLILTTYNCSNQSKTPKNAGWDFSIGGPHSTGTVRSVKPPQVGERKPEIPYGQAAPSRVAESGNWLAASGNAPRDIAESTRDSYNTGNASEDVNSPLFQFLFA